MWGGEGGSLCGAGLSTPTFSGFGALASGVITGPLEPILALAEPTTSTSTIAAFFRPNTTAMAVAIGAFPFAA